MRCEGNCVLTLGYYPDLQGLGQEVKSATAAQKELILQRVLSDPYIRTEVSEGTGLEEAMKRRTKKLEKSMKRRAINQAIATTAASITINMIPVVGQVLSAAMGLYDLIGSKGSEKELKKYIDKKKKELEDHVNRKQKELDRALSNAYQASYKDGVRLAKSFVDLTPIDYDWAEDHMKKVRKDPHAVSFEGLGIIGTEMGKKSTRAAKVRIDRMIKEAKHKINKATDPIIAEVKRPGFRSIMAKSIASYLRETPDFEIYGVVFDKIQPSEYKTPSASMPDIDTGKSNLIRNAAIVGGLGITALFLLR